ncbi:MAG: BON domain-containing protein [Gemmatimonadetes bacterium]|nr:BON domain-containing protein [Gemmatimonadota bacterium]
MSTGGPLSRYSDRLNPRRERESTLGISIATAAGFSAGLLAGLVLGEWLGDVHPERVRRILGGKRTSEPLDPAQVERKVLRAFKTTAATRRLNLSARALDGGLVELTGIAPDERTRQVAGDAAAQVAGPDLVVNRILVQGRDIPPGHTAPPTRS